MFYLYIFNLEDHSMLGLQLYPPTNPNAFNAMHDNAGSMEENFFKLEKVSSVTRSMWYDN